MTKIISIEELDERIKKGNVMLKKGYPYGCLKLLKEWRADKLAMIERIKDILHKDVAAFSSSRQYYRILDELKQLEGKT